MSTSTEASTGDIRNGRVAELQLIAAEFALARDSGARGVLLTGEPGIGKSWTLDAAVDRLSATDALVLRGYALDLPGAPPAYPLTRAFASVFRSDHIGSATQLDAPLAVLGGAGIAPPRAGQRSRPGVPADRLQVFDALAAVCETLAREQPLVLVLDDMQWARPFTWEALQYVLRSAGDIPLFALLAAREELLRRPEAEAVRPVGELIRLRLLRHMPLGSLDRDAIRALAVQRLGGEVSGALLDFLSRRSDGNPFLAEEVLADWQDRGVLSVSNGEWTIDDLAATSALEAPLTLRLTIGARLERLPAGVEPVLAAGSVLGRDFAARAVASMLSRPIDEVAALLRPAEDSALVDATPGGWRFRHDTIREAVAARHVAEMQRLHRAAAEALSRDAGYAPGYETLAATAHHWLAAGDPAAAAPAALSAAYAAAAAHATDEALALAKIGREALEQAHGAAAPDRRVAEARLAHGEAALAAGAFGAALEPLTSACDAAAVTAEPATEGIAWLRLGTLHQRQERVAEAAGAFARAMALLDEADDKVHLTEALIAFCNLEGLTRARYTAARVAGERARDLARDLGDRRLAARALLALANVEAREADPRSAQPLLVTAYEEAVAGDELALAAEICGTLANATYWAGEIRESWRHATRRLELAERAADVFAMRHAHSWLAFLGVTRGEWDEARELITRAERALARLESPEPLAFLHVVDGFLELRVGHLDRAIERLRGALAVFESVDPGTVVWYAGLLAFALAQAGRADEARRIAREQEARLAALPASALPARSARCALGLAYAVLADTGNAARCEEALRPYAGDFHWWPAQRTLGALAALRGERALALRDFTAVEVRMRAEEVMPEVALAMLGRAALLPPREAAAVTMQAEALLSGLEMTRDAARAHALVDTARAGGPAGLSPREIEVLRLLAQGMTNREIAAQLVISERTAVNHVSHIFDKVGVDNRAAATAFAHQHGLA